MDARTNIVQKTIFQTALLKKRFYTKQHRSKRRKIPCIAAGVHTDYCLTEGGLRMGLSQDDMCYQKPLEKETLEHTENMIKRLFVVFSPGNEEKTKNVDMLVATELFMRAKSRHLN